MNQAPPQSPPWQYPVVSSQYEEMQRERMKNMNETNQKSSIFEPSPPKYQKKKIHKLWDDKVNENELMETHQQPLKKIKSSVGIPCLNMLNFNTAPSKSTVYLPSPMAWGDLARENR